jgi:hypothetical protein
MQLPGARDFSDAPLVALLNGPLRRPAEPFAATAAPNLDARRFLDESPGFLFLRIHPLP